MNETEIAKRYIEIGWWTLVLTALVTVALAISGGFAYSYWITVGVSAPTLAFTIGALVALALLVFFAVIAYLAVQTWRDYVWHRQDIERMQAEALLREREPAPVIASAPVQVAPELPTETVNQMNADYRTALLIAEATLRELGKVADGETLRGKPFSYDRCQRAGLVSRWEQWSRVIALLEAAGVGEKLTTKSDWKFHVTNVHAAEERLRNHFVNVLGLVRVNGNWLRR